MAHDIRFAPRAAERLAAIAEWTVRSFGAAQVGRFVAQLADRLAAFAAGQAPAHPLDRLTGLARHEALMTLKAGRHLMILLPEGDGWVVIDILQDAQDLSSLTHDQKEP